MKTTPENPPCERCGKLKSEHCGEEFSCRTVMTPFRRCKADMPRLAVAPHPGVPLGSYVHTKSGGRYEVIGGVFDASGDGDEIQVLYQSVTDGYLAQRPIAEFAEKFMRVVHSGYVRVERIGGES